MAYNDNPAYLPLNGGTMTGTLTLNGDPIAANDAANKAYVDSISAGLTFKTAAVCATTVNLNANYLNGALGVGATLTNAGSLVAFTVDGVTPTINQRVLVKNQATTFQNGIYTISTLGTGIVAWILTRATDYDQVAEINPGDIVPVSTGSTQSNTNWLQTSFITTMGSSPITFQQYSSTPIQTTQYDVLVGGANNTVVSVGPGTSGQIFQSAGNASNPAYSTSTYPTTNAINTLLYASSANTMAALTTANNGVLITSSGGAPSISSTLPSAVQGNITSTGTVTSGTWSASTIAIAKGGTNATSFTQSNGIVAYNGTSLVNYAGPQLSTGGVMTNTSQPAFEAYPSAILSNVTGDGTTYQVAFNATNFDHGSSYDTTDFYYVIPKTGIYLFTVGIQLTGLTSSHTSAELYIQDITAGTYRFLFDGNPFSEDNSGTLTLVGSAIMSCTANDHVAILVAVFSGTKSVSVNTNNAADPRSWMSGYLIC